MFLEKRVYQGSSGKVYPLPFTNRIAEKPLDRKWKAIWIENELLRVLFAPSSLRSNCRKYVRRVIPQYGEILSQTKTSPHQYAVPAVGRGSPRTVTTEKWRQASRATACLPCWPSCALTQRTTRPCST
jgi:hypothetical protein